MVVADDQALVRAGFRSILDAQPGITVVGEAKDGRDAIDLVRRRRPRVVLMDVKMPDLDGIEATRRIVAEAGDETAVLVLTTFDADEYIYNALRAGASGFLLKDVPAEQLIEAVRIVARGDALIAPAVTRRLVEAFIRTAPAHAPGELRDLTPREIEVLTLGRARTVELRDRRRSGPERGDRQDARQACAGEARRARPRPGRRVRLRSRSRDPAGLGVR